MKSFLQHVAAVLAGAGPTLIALETVPGTVGKVALVLAGIFGAVVALRTEKPVAK